MSGPRLVFAGSPAEAPPPDGETTCVILDTTWTPAPGERADLLPLRRLAGDALRSADLFEEALDRLDRWAAAARMADLLEVGDTTYWYRLREVAWHWLLERLIWERVIRAARGPATPTSLAAPDEEVALLEVAAAVGRATGAEVLPFPRRAGDAAASAGAGAGAGAAGGAGAAARSPDRAAGAPRGGLAARLRRLVAGDEPAAIGRDRPRTASPGPATADRAATARREERLADRLRTLAGAAPGPVLVLTNTRLHQRIGDPAERRVEDPNLGPVIAALDRTGDAPVVLGLGLDHARDTDWPAIEADPRLVPQSLLRRWRTPGSSEQAIAAGLGARVRAAAAVPLAVDGVDLAPALADWLGEQAERVVRTILQQLPRVAGLLDALEPRAILLTHEGIQTPWLQAARARSIPVLAVQHGMIYPTHPGYRHPRDPRLPLPDVTFVGGPFERDVLLRHRGYAPGEVEVVGAPRLEMDRPPDAGPLDQDERERIRRAAGVAGDARLLVVSTGFLPLQRRFVLAATLERLFEEPLPDVHVVFKQHPGETDEGPYRELLVGLARAGGFDPPPISVVRDVDLYRLLRAADAHLGILSTVLTDAVIAGTPNLIAVDQAHADLLGYVEAGVARPVRDAAELREALADPRPADPAARGAFLAAHLRPGPASERIVTRIVALPWNPA